MAPDATRKSFRIKTNQNRGKPRHQSGIQTLSNNEPDVSKTERPTGQRRNSWSRLRHSLRWLQQELRWRNAEKILNKRRRAPKGEKSVLTDHVMKTNHAIAWNEATILRTNNNWHQRKILEAWEINCAKDPFNRDDGALLPKEYLHFLWRRSVIATETSGTFLL